MKYLCCKDIGQFDCDWECEGGSTTEIMEKVSLHAKDIHGLADIPGNLLDQVRFAIRDL